MENTASLCSAANPDVLHCSTIQHNTAQYSAVKYNTIQYSTSRWDILGRGGEKCLVRCFILSCYFLLLLLLFFIIATTSLATISIPKHGSLIRALCNDLGKFLKQIPLLFGWLPADRQKEHGEEIWKLKSNWRRLQSELHDIAVILSHCLDCLFPCMYSPGCQNLAHNKGVGHTPPGNMRL